VLKAAVTAALAFVAAATAAFLVLVNVLFRERVAGRCDINADALMFFYPAIIFLNVGLSIGTMLVYLLNYNLKVFVYECIIIFIVYIIFICLGYK